MKTPAAAKAPSKSVSPVQPVKVAPAERGATNTTRNELWSRMATGASTGISVAPPNTERERAADRVAQQTAGPQLQRDYGTTGSSQVPQVDRSTQARLQSPNSGESIDPSLRAPVERIVRQDLGHARIHTAPADRAAADAMRARAFAFNNHIYLGSGYSARDQRLMAHELAHVAAPIANTLQRDPITDAGAPAGAPAPVPAPAGSAPSSAPPTTPATPTAATADFKSALDTSVVELKGHRTFDPSKTLNDEIESLGGEELYVRVRFGSMAEGIIPIRWTDQGFKTPAPKEYFPAWGIPLAHAAFPGAPGAQPTLWIVVNKGVVTGGMGWITPVALADNPDKFRELIPTSDLIGGMSNFQNVKLKGQIVDSLKNGKFTYSVPEVAFDSDDFHGSAVLRVVDEEFKLEGGLDVPVTGMPSKARVPLTRESAGGLLSAVSGSAQWQFDRNIGPSGKLHASITATLSKGVMDVRGFGEYDWSDPKDPTRRISGQITIVVTNFDDAKQKVIDQLGPDAPAHIQPAAPNEELAITGWGELDLTLSDWISGNAEVVVHPEGFVTARGEILPKKIIQLTDKHAKEAVLAKPPEFVEVLTGIPFVGDLRVEASATLLANGSFGPGTLHDLRITGLISSDPAIVNRFQVGGVISSPAEAALHLKATVSLSAYLAHLKEVASVSINADGILRLKMYAEADAAVGRRASAKPPGDSEYYLQAHAIAAAGLELAVSLKANGKLALLGDLELDLVDRTWPIGGTAARIDLSYIFGRGKEKDSEVTTAFTGIDFDEGKFARAVARGKAVEAKGYKGVKSADTKAESDVVNADAPVPFSPDSTTPGVTSPPTTTPVTPIDPNAPPASANTTVKVLDEQFDMNGEPHTLHLALVNPPSIDMESPPPRENLLGKITRARKKLQKEKEKVDAPRANLTAQLLALDVMEKHATQVLEAAVRIAAESPYLSPRVPGYSQLASLIHDYGNKFGLPDLPKALAVATLDPNSPETVLVRYPKLAGSELNRQMVARALEQDVSATALRKIVDYCQTYGFSDDIVEELINNIYFMAAARIVGYQTAISEMASQRTKTKGGEFILRYLGRNRHWTGNVQLEVGEDDANGDRRWDAWIEGALYEFKAWRDWSGKLEEAFLKQIVDDHGKIRAGKDMPLRWVFNGEIALSKLHSSMERALQKEIEKVKDKTSKIPNATESNLAEILGQIRTIVRVSS